jgi:hypothetical protein
MSTHCVITYKTLPEDPPHMSGTMFKGLKLVDGGEYTVTNDLAGHALFAFPGRVTVKSGDPTPWTPGTASAKAAAKTAAEQAKLWNRDPADALKSVQPLPPAVLKAIRVPKESDAVKAIDEGAADAHLGGVALWAQLGGLVDLATAAARRAEALKPKG